MAGRLNTRNETVIAVDSPGSNDPYSIFRQGECGHARRFGKVDGNGAVTTQVIIGDWSK